MFRAGNVATVCPERRVLVQVLIALTHGNVRSAAQNLDTAKNSNMLRWHGHLFGPLFAMDGSLALPSFFVSSTV